MTTSPFRPTGWPGWLSARRPGTVSAAVSLLIAAALLFIPIGVFSANPLAAVFLLVTVVSAVRALGGLRWSRTMTVAATALQCFLLSPYALLGFSESYSVHGPGYALLDIAALLASCVGVGLLYDERSTPHFRR